MTRDNNLLTALDNIYSFDIRRAGYLEKLYALDNPFVRQLAVLATSSAKELKVLNVVTKNNLVNRGETALRGIAADAKSVIDICKLTSLTGHPQFKNLMEEIAYYRWCSLGFDTTPGYEEMWRKKAPLLMIDYLLSVCVCYVEVFETGIKVDKFFATRNRFLAGALAEMNMQDTVKWNNFLTPLMADYDANQLRMLKLNKTKEKFKVTQPRSGVDFNKSVKVTPIFLMTSFLEGITDILQEKILRITYIKDNLQERETFTSFNTPLLLQYYPQEFVQTMYSHCSNNLSRGYVQLPELGISKYDKTGVRALNISRITSIEIVDHFDTRFIDVDFDQILYTFKTTIDRLTDFGMLSFVYSSIVQDAPPSNVTITEMQTRITSFVDSQYALGTTTFLKQLHLFMLGCPQIFVGYTGKRVSYSGFQSSNFNLGIM